MSSSAYRFLDRGRMSFRFCPMGGRACVAVEWAVGCSNPVAAVSRTWVHVAVLWLRCPLGSAGFLPMLLSGSFGPVPDGSYCRAPADLSNFPAWFLGCLGSSSVVPTPHFDRCITCSNKRGFVTPALILSWGVFLLLSGCCAYLCSGSFQEYLLSVCPAGALPFFSC